MSVGFSGRVQSCPLRLILLGLRLFSPHGVELRESRHPYPALLFPRSAPPVIIVRGYVVLVVCLRQVTPRALCS